MSHRSFILAVTGLLLAVLVGCKDSNSPTDNGGGGGGGSTFTSGFTGNAVSLAPGTSAAAKLTGGTAPFSITSAPNAAVATASISNDSIRISAVAPGTTSVMVSDASPSSGDAQTLTIAITVPVGSTITVSGAVKDFGDEPISGAAVLIPGKTPVTSGADGSFSISGVTTPYDITFVVSSARGAIVYKGLTRPDPTLHYFNSFFGTPKNATISGTVPAATGKTTRVIYISGDESWSTTASTTTGSYSFTISWRGDTQTQNGRLYVLRWTAGANGMPTAYDAYGDRDLAVSAGGTFSNNNFTAGQLTDPAEMNISGSVTRPSTNYTLTSRTMYIGFGNAIVTLASEGGTLGDNLSYTTANITGATYAILARAQHNSSSRGTQFLKKDLAPGAQGVSIPLTEAPQLSLPVSGGTQIDTSTSFLFSQGGGTGANIILVSPNSSSDPAYQIFSSAATFTIPNLAGQGLGLPSNRNYNWQVARLYPFSSMDEVASPTLIPRFSGRSGDVGQSGSETFTFTTR